MEIANSNLTIATHFVFRDNPNGATILSGVLSMLAVLGHLAPKQILINAHVNMRDDLILDDVLRTNEVIEDLIKRADPKVEMIFPETARASDSTEKNVVPEHMA